MESKKVKEIKKALEYAIDMGLVIGKNTMFVNIKLADILTLINELESENERLKWEKQTLEDKDTLLAKVGEMVQENQQLKARIAELEKENKILTKDIVFSDDKVDMFGKPVILTIGGVALGEAYNRIVNYEQEQQRIKELEKEVETRKEEVLHLQEYGKALIRETELKQFAERLKKEIVSMKWAREDTNEKLIKQGATIKAIDKTLKEFVDE